MKTAFLERGGRLAGECEIRGQIRIARGEQAGALVGENGRAVLLELLIAVTEIVINGGTRTLGGNDFLIIGGGPGEVTGFEPLVRIIEGAGGNR